MFEKASRLKIRFASSKGQLSIEDLWDLPLFSSRDTSLDDIAKALNRQLKAAEEESFVTKASISDEIIMLKFNIVKHIIAIRLEEIDVAEKAKATRAKKQQIMAIIANKESDALLNNSLEDLQKMLEEL